MERGRNGNAILGFDIGVRLELIPASATTQSCPLNAIMCFLPCEESVPDARLFLS